MAAATLARSQSQAQGSCVASRRLRQWHGDDVLVRSSDGGCLEQNELGAGRRAAGVVVLWTEAEGREAIRFLLFSYRRRGRH